MGPRSVCFRNSRLAFMVFTKAKSMDGTELALERVYLH